MKKKLLAVLMIFSLMMTYTGCTPLQIKDGIDAIAQNGGISISIKSNGTGASGTPADAGLPSNVIKVSDGRIVSQAFSSITAALGLTSYIDIQQNYEKGDTGYKVLVTSKDSLTTIKNNMLSYLPENLKVSVSSDNRLVIESTDKSVFYVETDENNSLKLASCGDTILHSIVSIEDIAPKTVGFGVKKESIGLPSAVKAVLDDKSTVQVSVAWDNGTPEYNGGVPRDCIFTGTISGTDIKPTVKVTVKSQPPVSGETIVSVDAVNPISVDLGTSKGNIGLPSTVSARKTDGSRTDLVVTWNGGNPSYDGNKAGDCIFTGNFKETDITVQVKVTVKNQPVTTPPIVDSRTVVAKNGQLKVVGTQLVNKDSQPIQLKGIAGYTFPNNYTTGESYVNYNTMKYLRDNWNLSIFRVAMFTNMPGSGAGYIQSPEQHYAFMTKTVDSAISLGIYVIVDWHIQNENPQKFESQARDFFDKISKKYANVPNVIYEIANEPNPVTWEANLKPYSIDMITTIRKNSPDAVVLVGTPFFSNDLASPAKSPLDFKNIMYVKHFYAGSIGQNGRNAIDAALNQNLPVFVTEWGVTNDSGNGALYLEESQKWVDYMKDKKISWVNWMIFARNQTCSALKMDADIKGNINENSFSPSGLFVEKAMKQ